MEKFIEGFDVISFSIRSVVYFITMLTILFDSIQEAKEPFDKKGESRKFHLKKHWWAVKYDNIPVWFLKGFIGGMVVAGEFGTQILDYFFDLEDMTDLSITLTPVALCTFLFARPKRLSVIISSYIGGFFSFFKKGK